MNKVCKPLSLLLITVALACASLAQTPRPTPAAITIEPASFDRYVGQYEDPVNLKGIVFSFFREGDKYYLRLTAQDKLEITPSAANAFFNLPHNFDLEFRSDAAGNITGLRFTQGTTFELKRTANTPQVDTRVAYKKLEVMIPMRDGVNLHTLVFTPEDQTERLPFYMERTPYGIGPWSSNRINQNRTELARERYIFVFQDIRGREKSEGKFILMHPPRDKRDPKSTDESSDTYDTIEWLLKNIPNNNGRVGIAGVSYPGWLAAVALLDRHPALKASSPQAPVTDVWLGDDLFHNGAFRQTYAHDWAYTLEASNMPIDVDYGGEKDMVKWYWPIGKTQSLAPELAPKSPSWQAFIDHPAWDSYWQARATELYLKHADIPTLIVGGWWDQEDMFGPLTMYKTLQKTDKDNQVFLVMGPWNHGGWGGRGHNLQSIDFGSDTGTYFRENIQAPFFAHYLKDKGNYVPPEASIFESGSNKWMAYDSWTPKNARTRDIYLGANRHLSFDKPSDKTDAFDSYVSDPANPVTYRKGQIFETYGQGSTWYTWRADDQRFLADRGDVLKWQSDVLTDDFTITGDVMAKLFASTSGSDSDWVVKLIDVYGADEGDLAGYQLMVSEEIFRGRYRESYEKAAALKPNTPLDYAIDLHGNDHVFKKGHRIMVQIQSTWFPLYDRNPQTFVPNIFKATPTDFKPAIQRIFRSGKYPSHVTVTVPRN